MHLPMLDDKELLTYAEQTMHALTTSDLERELIKRLQARVDQEAEEVEEVDDERLVVLDDEGIDDADALRTHFATVANIKSAVDDL